MNSVKSKFQNLKYRIFTPSAFKDIGITFLIDLKTKLLLINVT